MNFDEEETEAADPGLRPQLIILCMLLGVGRGEGIPFLVPDAKPPPQFLTFQAGSHIPILPTHSP